MLGSLLVQMFWARTVFLFSDDYIFLSQGLSGRLSWDYLASPLFGHFSPVSRLTHLLVAPAVADHPEVIFWGLITGAACVVASTAFLMTSMLQRSGAALLGTFLVGTSLTIAPLTNWWTAGVNILPGVTGAFLCIGALVRLLESSRRRWAVVAVAGFALAVLSWELAAIAPIYAVLWALMFGSATTGTAYRELIRRTAVAWIPIAVIGMAAGVNYLANYNSHPTPPSVLVLLTGLGSSLIQSLVPLGVGLYPTDWGLLNVLIPIVTAGLLAYLVLLTVRRQSTAWRGWVFALLGWLLPSFLLVMARAGIYGFTVAQLPVYFLLPVSLATVGALLAWTEPSGRGATPHRHGLTLDRRRRLAITGLVMLLVVGYGFSGPAAVMTLSHALTRYGPPQPGYVTQLISDLASARGHGSFSVINGDVAGGLVPGTFSPYNRVEKVIRLYAPWVIIDASTAPWYVVDGSGELRSATVAWVTTESFSTVPVQAIQARGVEHLTVDAQRGLCFDVLESSAVVVVPLPFVVSKQYGVIRTEASVDRSTPGRVIFLTGEGWQAANADQRTWSPASQTRLEPASGAGSRVVGFDSMSPGTSMCVRQMEFGSISAGTAG